MIPALIVGGWTAWYLGLRLGAIVAAVTFAALLAAMFIPGLRLAVYVLVIAWCAALYFFGPKLSKASGKASMSSVVGSPLGQATAYVKKLIDQVRK